jgi:hypothetical protein
VRSINDLVYLVVSVEMHMEKEKSPNGVSPRLLLMSGCALVTLGLMVGYAGRDLFLGNSNVSVADTLSTDSVSAKPSPNKTYSTELKQNSSREGPSLVRQKANLHQQAGDQTAWIEILSEERTANIDRELGGLNDDPEFEDYDPDRVAELLEKHNFEIQQLDQQQAEAVALQAPPSLELDDDSLEDLYLAENLPEIDATEDMEGMLEGDEQEAVYLEQEQVNASPPLIDTEK